MKIRLCICILCIKQNKMVAVVVSTWEKHRKITFHFVPIVRVLFKEIV